MIEILITALLGGYLCFFLLAVFPELLPPSPVATWWVFRMVWRYRGRRGAVPCVQGDGAQDHVRPLYALHRPGSRDSAERGHP